MALDDVSLDIRRGEFFSLLGPSGCGKTTLLRLIGGFESADAGDVLIDGKSVAGLPPCRRATNMIFQHLALFPHMNVFENIAFGLRMKGMGKAGVEARIGKALDDVMGRYQHTRCAVSALKRVVAGERVAQRLHQRIVVEPFDGADIGTVARNRVCDAASHRSPVDQHRAGTTHAVLAAEVGTGQAERIPDEVGEVRTGLDGRLD